MISLKDAKKGIDFSKPIPAGEYLVVAKNIIRIEGKKFISPDGVASQSNPSYNLQMQVIEGEFLGKTLWDRLYDTAEARGRFADVLSVFGVLSPERQDLELPTEAMPTLKLQGEPMALVKVIIRNGYNRPTFNGYRNGLEADTVTTPDAVINIIKP